MNFSGVTNFNYNSAHKGGGVISTSANSLLSFNGTSNFVGNSGTYGGVIYSDANSYMSLSFTGISRFINNSAYYYGGVVYTSDNTNTLLNFTGNSNFDNNFALKQGGAISANGNTTMTFNGTMSFTNNGHVMDKDMMGGGVYLGVNSTFCILPNTTVVWENNHASFGGAIYVDEHNPFIYCPTFDIVKGECFFQLPGQNLSNSIDAQLVFKNNSADAAGSALYGGAIDHCLLTGMNSYSSGEVFDKLVNIEDDNSTSTISSDAFRICPCAKHLDCSKSDISHSIYPGETFQVYVAAVGQRDGTVPTAVRSRIGSGIQSNSIKLLGYQYLQQVSNACSILSFTVFSQPGQVSLELFADGPCSTFGDELVISLSVNHTCLPGFRFSSQKVHASVSKDLRYIHTTAI